MEERTDSQRWSNEFAKALISDGPPEQPKVSLWRRVATGCAAASQQRTLLILGLAVATVLLLILLRPPFVMAFEYDQRRPWRGGSHVSWLSITCVTSVVILVPVVLHLITPS